MVSIRTLVALLLIAFFLSGTANANTSSINPNVPAQNSPLSSSVLRGNFLAAYTDINTIYGSVTLNPNQIVGAITAGIATRLSIPACSPASGNALGGTNGVGILCQAISGGGGSSGVSSLPGDSF